MKKSKIVSKLTGLASLGFGISFALTSCTVITNPGLFKVITAADVTDKTSYPTIKDELLSPIQTAIYGTNLINNGNYVLTVLTNTDSEQNYFINGGDLSSGVEWSGPYARAIQRWQNDRTNPNYPTGVLFLLYWDLFDNQRAPSDQLNPFSRATSGSGFARNDKSAVDYRAIVDFILKTYPTETSSWLNRSNGTTKIMNIAFSNDGTGKITPHFYMGSGASSSAMTPAATPTTASSVRQSLSLKSATIDNSKPSNHDLTIDDSFSTFLAGIYTRN
ncbi:hypothetical protein H3143_00800 [Mycoplasma tullyi]|uniref:Lipoprotein n=1 Tax=Mycoplasma tullyi TaxID=1612150 RepID=A0A7D7UB23_9MOLU|nr:hypothetical protein [Mycoplasma tullyi]QMT98667.1 hypothetical protein H3143_00800 [Mycoplasma tullyi]